MNIEPETVNWVGGNIRIVRKILETLQFKEVRQNPYNKKFKEYYLTEEQWQKMKPGSGPLTGATLQQTMGPNFKDLYYSPMNRPYVLKEEKGRVLSL